MSKYYQVESLTGMRGLRATPGGLESMIWEQQTKRSTKLWSPVQRDAFFESLRQGAGRGRGGEPLSEETTSSL